MSIRHNRRFSRLLLLLTFVSLACKFLIPVGYMPASFSEGWPVRMCHTGLPEGFLSRLDHHAEHESASESGWEHCSLGAAYSASAITSEYALNVAYLGEALPSFDADRLSIDTTDFVIRSRGPPARIL